MINSGSGAAIIRAARRTQGGGGAQTYFQRRQQERRNGLRVGGPQGRSPVPTTRRRMGARRKQTSSAAYGSFTARMPAVTQRNRPAEVRAAQVQMYEAAQRQRRDTAVKRKAQWDSINTGGTVAGCIWGATEVPAETPQERHRRLKAQRRAQERRAKGLPEVQGSKHEGRKHHRRHRHRKHRDGKHHSHNGGGAAATGGASPAKSQYFIAHGDGSPEARRQRRKQVKQKLRSIKRELREERATQRDVQEELWSLQVMKTQIDGAVARG